MHIVSEEFPGGSRGLALAGLDGGLPLRSIVPDHDVGDRNFELAPQAHELTALLPRFAVARMGDDDHLVGAESPQLVLECGGGVRVADFPRATILCSCAQTSERARRVRASASSPSMSDTA